MYMHTYSETSLICISYIQFPHHPQYFLLEQICNNPTVHYTTVPSFIQFPRFTHNFIQNGCVWISEVSLYIHTYNGTCHNGYLCTQKDHLPTHTNVVGSVVHSMILMYLYIRTTCLQRPQILSPLSGFYRQAHCTRVCIPNHA